MFKKFSDAYEKNAIFLSILLSVSFISSISSETILVILSVKKNLSNELIRLKDRTICRFFRLKIILIEIKIKEHNRKIDNRLKATYF